MLNNVFKLCSHIGGTLGVHQLYTVQDKGWHGDCLAYTRRCEHNFIYRFRDYDVSVDRGDVYLRCRILK